MRQLLFCLIVCVYLIACSNKASNNFPLPNKNDIDAIVKIIIDRDSLASLDIPLAEDLSKIKIFNPPGPHFLPPPPGFNNINIWQLAMISDSVSGRYRLTKQDSLYMLFQNDTLKHFEIDKTLASKIRLTSSTVQKKQRSDGKHISYFSISIPVFTLNRQKAYVQLDHFCSPECGSGSVIVLKKINNKWTIIKHFRTWIN